VIRVGSVELKFQLVGEIIEQLPVEKITRSPSKFSDFIKRWFGR